MNQRLQIGDSASLAVLQRDMLKSYNNLDAEDNEIWTVDYLFNDLIKGG